MRTAQHRVFAHATNSHTAVVWTDSAALIGGVPLVASFVLTMFNQLTGDFSISRGMRWLAQVR